MTTKRLCEAFVTEGKTQRKCRAVALKGERFCPMHLPGLSTKIEAIKALLLMHGADFFTNKDVRLKVGKILKGIRLKRPVDKDFMDLMTFLRKEALKSKLRLLHRKAWRDTWTEIIREAVAEWERKWTFESQDAGSEPCIAQKERRMAYVSRSS